MNFLSGSLIFNGARARAVYTQQVVVTRAQLFPIPRYALAMPDNRETFDARWDRRPPSENEKMKKQNIREYY